MGSWKEHDAALLTALPSVKARQNCWEQVFEAVDGFKLSRCDRAKHVKNTYGHSLTYGEVCFPSFMRLLQVAVGCGGVPSDGSATFVDLGCGVGRAVIAAALCPMMLFHEISLEGNDQAFFSSCIGVELLPSLARAAAEVVPTVREHAGCALPSCLSIFCEDIVQFAWTQYDVVFCHNIMFSSDLTLALLDRSKSLRPGSVLILNTDPSHMFASLGNIHDWFKVSKFCHGEFRMSFGHPAMYVLTRISCQAPRTWTPMLQDSHSMRVQCDRWYQAVASCVDGDLPPAVDSCWLGSEGYASDDLPIVHQEAVRFCSCVLLLFHGVRFGNMPRDGSASFLHIGCGIGKELLIASLLLIDWVSLGSGNTPAQTDAMPNENRHVSLFRRCIGVESASPFAARATEAIRNMQKIIAAEISTNAFTASSQITVLSTSIFQIDFSEFDMILLDATSFGKNMLTGIMDLAIDLSIGATLLVLVDDSSELPMHDAFNDFSVKTLPPGYFHGCSVAVVLLTKQSDALQ